MASQGLEPPAGNPQAPSFEGCSGPSLPEDPAQGAGLVKDPVSAEDPGSGVPRSVLSERERRKRISVSCERLRALLPRFEGRREDMASVLEMAVQFLQLAHTLVPSWEQHTVPALSREAWHTWREDALQLTLASQIPDGGPDPGTPASSMTLQWEPLCCATLGLDKNEVSAGSSELLDGPPSLPEPSGLSPRPPPQSVSQRPPSPEMSKEGPGGLCPAGGAASPGGLAKEAEVGPSAPASDARSVSGADVEDGLSFLLSTSPDWWPGSPEDRGGAAPARSSPMDRVEPDFLGDPAPSSPDLQDMELWVSDVGSWGLALREEVDSIFPDDLAC